MKYIDEYKNPEISGKIVKKIHRIATNPIRIMEVCGTHTMSIFKNGIRSLLPETITLLSGPGCPVCVTAQNEIDAFIELGKRKDTIITTFGDLIRVPGSGTSLARERAAGREIRVVYSPMDALETAKKNPDRETVFLGVGFETTAPTIAATIIAAKDAKVGNFSVFSAHKLVPPALAALTSTKDLLIDGFLLPGHVSVIIGKNAYRDFFDAYRIPCVIAGFEPMDLLFAINELVGQIMTGCPKLENAYDRVVTDEGNPMAMNIMEQVFEPADAVWRGIGTIPGSGLKIRSEFEAFDAEKRFGLVFPESIEPKGCACGDILTGRKRPPDCALYKKVCTPMNPVGPCMVSSEGTCAAYYRYSDDISSAPG